MFCTRDSYLHEPHGCSGIARTNRIRVRHPTEFIALKMPRFDVLESTRTWFESITQQSGRTRAPIPRKLHLIPSDSPRFQPPDSTTRNNPSRFTLTRRFNSIRPSWTQSSTIWRTIRFVAIYLDFPVRLLSRLLMFSIMKKIY